MYDPAETQTTPTVSIVVPVYNVADYLDECMKSLLNQTVTNIEIILVDDGSTDGSAELCDRWTLEDSRVKVLHQPNSGVSIARNNGIRHAAGTWIMFADSDDWLPSDSLEILLKAMEEEPDCDLTVGAQYWNYPDHQSFEGGEDARGVRYVLDLAQCRKEIVEYVIEGIYFPGLSEIQCELCGPCAKLYRRSFLEQHSIQFVPHQVKSEDQVFNLYVVQNARKLVVINLPVYHYRIWDGSFCQRFGRNLVSMDVMVFWKREVERFLNTYGYGDALCQFFTFHRAKQMSSIWLQSYILGELTWQEVRENIGALKENGFPVVIRNPYYSWKNRVFAFALKYRLCRVLLLLQKLMNQIWK